MDVRAIAPFRFRECTCAWRESFVAPNEIVAGYVNFIHPWDASAGESFHARRG
jgi:hypothetical protein